MHVSDALGAKAEEAWRLNAKDDKVITVLRSEE